MYLIDTNVLSEFRKAESGRADPRVALWAAQTLADSMYLSVVTILELQIGALRIERRDSAQSSVRRWIND
jgi:predicted nucleic acid-binding protein